MIKCTVLPILLFVLLTSKTHSQGVGVNLSGNAPNNSSILDVSASDQGVLIPRVTLTSTTDATTITNGNVLSLLIFNTATIADVTPGYYYWDGSVWTPLGKDADNDPNNEIELPTGGSNGQVLSTDGSGNYTWVSDASGTDNQDLSLSGDILSLTNDATTVDLSVLKDHDWYEVGSTNQADNINDNIFTQGNVGIKETNPTNDLSIGANLGTGYGISVNPGTPYGGVIQTTESPATNNPAFWVRTDNGGTIDHLFRVQNNGRVGIKTNTPLGNLHIYNPTAFTGNDNDEASNSLVLHGSVDNQQGNHFGSISWQSGGRKRAGITSVMEHSDGDYLGLAFWTQGTDGPGPMYESMRISHAGYVGINTTAPTEMLDVIGSVKITDGTEATGNILMSDATGKAHWENGAVKESSNGSYKQMCSGSTTPGVGWVQYGADGIYIDVNTSGCGFTSTPRYITSIQGGGNKWLLTGVTSIYSATATGFRIYLKYDDGNFSLTPAYAASSGYQINWIAIEN
ncbi:MAG: hypothetical protein N4A35_10585 [Flavobacteriales bacterium]|jgi:hypothetical protein|nr:hypothetical protein [Flavobacteriales bacterium]